MPIHIIILGELISVQIHAAHVFTPGRLQENIPGELFMYWFRARGYLPQSKRKVFFGHFEEFIVFEIFCWGVTVTGASKISKISTLFLQNSGLHEFNQTLYGTERIYLRKIPLQSHVCPPSSLKMGFRAHC